MRWNWKSVFVAWIAGATVVVAEPVEFGRQVLPVLADRCFSCHGPDEKARKGRLRLDVAETNKAGKSGKPLIVGGRPNESELWRRVSSNDPDVQMPPPDFPKKLTPAEIATLRQWIETGGVWSRHWAFEPIRRPAIPANGAPGRVVNEIDRFILARLPSEGLLPSPEADRERLIRRVSFDLTGLPPTPGEVDAFVADRGEGAYERLVDRLLRSPRYGETMATDWLDLARYADTHGFQMDRYRAMWPWRDWVVRAFNENLPFDRFVTWQLAGDLLPHPTQEQRLATAFNRLHLQNEEGGIVEEEYRVAYVVDRVNTFGATFLGLTLDCARCHDHKFDPVRQRDFYQLFACFQNIDESGQSVYFGDIMPTPTLLLSTPNQDRRLEDLADAASRARDALSAEEAAAGGRFEDWLARRPATPPWPGQTGWFSFDKEGKDGFENLADPEHPAKPVENPALVDGWSGKALGLDGESGVVFPGLGGYGRSDAFSYALWLRPATNLPRAVVVHKSRAWMDAGSRGYELVLEGGRLAASLNHMWPGNALKVRARAALAPEAWTHVAVTYDGSSRAAGLKIYVNGTLADSEVVRDGLWRGITYGGGEPDLAIGHRFRDNGFKGGRVDEFRLFNRELSALEAGALAGGGDLQALLEKPAAGLTGEDRTRLLEFYLKAVDGPRRQAAQSLAEARGRHGSLVDSIPDIMVMDETAKPKPAFILKRGAYDAPGEEVRAGTPLFLPPLPAGAPNNRLGLAQWLLAPENPLFARVTVNRAWQRLFGRGLVETAENLGTQGSPPTHPELLDWLADDFRTAGWDYKRLLRAIAVSATYRQSSRETPEALARDPGNRWWARGPVRRLTAEMVRDQALAASGLLAETLGGPAVRPYQPDGVWEVAMGNPRYTQAHGADLFRRSLYTFWKRTAPPPMMITFDSAERNLCAARRQSTSTPLQALTLLNDPQVVEASRRVALRARREAQGGIESRLSYAFRLVTDRRPSARELSVAVRLFREEQEEFKANPDAARRWLAVGESGPPPPEDPSDRAGLAAEAATAAALFNHDEAVMRR